MKLAELAELLEGFVLVGHNMGDLEIDRAYAADLLSDVLALTDESTTLVTGLINPQVMRVADILNVVAVVFVRGKRPSDAMIDHAQRAGIPVVVTRKTMFETCGQMYENGVRPCRNRPMSSPESVGSSTP